MNESTALLRRASVMLRSWAVSSWEEARLADEIDAFLEARSKDKSVLQLRAVALAAQALVRSVQPGLSPDTEIVSEPALTALESALAAAGYDSTIDETLVGSPVETGHPVVACIYRKGCRKHPQCMNEARCCGRDTVENGPAPK